MIVPEWGTLIWVDKMAPRTTFTSTEVGQHIFVIEKQNGNASSFMVKSYIELSSLQYAGRSAQFLAFVYIS